MNGNSAITGEAASVSHKTRDGKDPDVIRNFLDFLMQNGWLDKGGAERAVQAQSQTSHRIDIVLSELGLISAPDLLDASARYFGLDVASQADFPAQPVADERLPLEFLRRGQIYPLAITPHTAVIAIADPFNSNLLATVAYLLERPVEARLGSAALIEAALQHLGDGEAVEVADPLAAATGAANEDDIQRLRDIASEAPVIRFVTKIIANAISQRASDIHIEPSLSGLRVRYRIDGVMREVERLPLEMQAGVASRIKILARLNIAERRLPQDGRTKFIAAGREVDLRVSSAPVMHGESIVLRILDQNQVDLSFEALGFDAATAGEFTGLLQKPNGILLVTGPTGSGKTTTLYSALKQLNSIERKIFSVEDPIEYQLPGINQMQIKPSIGLDFIHALRSILRQDPDVIMIGEMRDVETARIGIQASLTGHLVLSTLHTNSAAASVTRLLDMGVEDYLLASTLSAVLAQRLVRRLCRNCASPAQLAPSQEAEICSTLKLSALPAGVTINRAVGCPQCNHTGFQGRTTITELLVIDDNLRRHIKRGTADYTIENAGRERGMRTLYQSGLYKMLAGETTLAEVLRAARG
ncbi:MAG: ATPase, T2SS/T4P/T4SS family [Hyphomicrobiaceae bacterium]